MSKIRVFITSVILISMLTVGSFAVDNEMIFINGEEVILTNSIITTESNVYLSLRELGEVLGYEIKWDALTLEVILVNDDDDEFRFKNGENIARSKLENYSMKSPVFIDNGKSYIPLNAVVDVFGMKLSIVNDVYSINKFEGEMIESQSMSRLYELAKENSEALKTAERNVDRYDVTQDNAQDNLGSTAPASTGNSAEDAARLALYQNYYAQGIGLEMSKKTVVSTEEKIFNTLYSAVEKVLYETEKLEIAELNAEVSETTHKQNNLKFELGLISQLDVENSEVTLESAKRQFEIQKLTVENAWVDLNEMVGFESDKRYTFDYKMTMEKLEDRDVERHIDYVIKKSPDLWNLEQQISLAENSVRFYVFNSSSDPFDAEEIDVSLARINLKSAKDGYEESQRTMFNSIVTLEESDGLLAQKVIEAENAYKLASQNYEVGLATELNVKTATLALENAKLNQLDNVKTYLSTIRLYEKPWIAQ